MSAVMKTPDVTIGAEVTLCEEVPMVRRERWEEIRRLWVSERVPIAEIARRLDLDRKTVRRCLRDTAWRSYHHPVRPDTLLTAHAEYLRERALIRFETPPGRQSQIDWGQAQVPLRHTSAVRHIFVLTLGFSRRSYNQPCLNETLLQFLVAHERAFEYFGAHTREHLYDRPRTV